MRENKPVDYPALRQAYLIHEEAVAAIDDDYRYAETPEDVARLRALEEYHRGALAWSYYKATRGLNDLPSVMQGVNAKHVRKLLGLV